MHDMSDRTSPHTDIQKNFSDITLGRYEVADLEEIHLKKFKHALNETRRRLTKLRRKSKRHGVENLIGKIRKSETSALLVYCVYTNIFQFITGAATPGYNAHC
jgi:hypothetical protein